MASARASALRQATPSSEETGARAVFHQGGAIVRAFWTNAEDAELRCLWDEGLAITRIAARLERSRMAVYQRARRLGLPLGVPDAFEGLTAAAARAGMEPETLRRAFRWAGKKVRRTLSEPYRHHTHRLMVDPLDVDEVVAIWTRSESVRAAARRLGISEARLRDRLRKLGYRPRVGGQGRAWRITPQQLAAANAIAVWRNRNHQSSRRAA